jgi:hypothetical protein
MWLSQFLERELRTIRWHEGRTIWRRDDNHQMELREDCLRMAVEE